MIGIFPLHWQPIPTTPVRMPPPSRTVSQLNQQRRQAALMRQAGAKLAEIRLATGLSIPTIIASHKAYVGGGLRAVEISGKQRGARRKELPKAIQTALHHALFNSSPQSEGVTGHYVWQRKSVATWLQTRHSIDISLRDAGHWLQRLTLNTTSLLDDLRHSHNAIVHAWLRQSYPAYLKRARQSGGRVLWVAERNIAGMPHHQLYAHTPRGHFQWLIVPRAPTMDNWRFFLEALHKQLSAKLYVVFANPYLEDKLGQWLASHRDEFETICIPYGFSTTLTPKISTIHMSNSLLNRDTPTPLTHLQRLEAESIHIMREVVAEADNPVMLYSIGKDSAVMLHLAMKAFYPAIPPFPLLHVDTRWKFRDMYAFRDKMAEQVGMQLLVHINPEGVEKDINPFTHGSAIHTHIMKTEGLKQALNQHKFDVAFGGARRDEEKSRAKERIFSFRTAQHQWDPKQQRPELWKLYNTRKHKGESIRVFPLSNWTELDIWQYIYLENIPIVPLYYSAIRPVVERDGTLIMVDDDRMPLAPGETPMMRKVRFRTLGCYPLTGAIESEADTLPAIIQEMLLARTSERQGRVIDHDSAASMEKKKQEGYF